MFTDLITDRNDRFVVRFWNFTADEHARLLKEFRHLASGHNEHKGLRLSATAYGLHTLLLRRGSKDQGAIVEPSSDSVVWELQRAGWRSVLNLASAVQAGSTSFRWLDQRNEVSVLLSPTGRW